VEKAAGWPTGGQALPDARAVGWVHSVGTVGNVGSRGKGIPGGVVGMVQQGRAATGRVQVEHGQCLEQLGALGKWGRWVAGQNSS